MTVKSFFKAIPRHEFLCCVLINLLLMAVNLFVFRPYYETNDDSVLARTVSGFNGENDPHLIFINVIVGYVLRFFYSLNEQLPWFDFFQIFISFCSIVCIMYFLVKMIKGRYRYLIAVIPAVFISFELYVVMQYTKTAGFASAAGLLIILLFTLFEKPSVPKIAAGVLLAATGFMLRTQSFLMSLLLCSSIGIYYLFGKKKLENKQFWKRLLACGCSVVALFGAIGITLLADKNAYSSPDWQDYSDRYKIVSNITDYHFTQFDVKKLKELDIGKDETDAVMLKRWIFQDLDNFSNENLEKMFPALISNDTPPQERIGDFFAKFYECLFVRFYIPFYMFLACLLFMLITRFAIALDRLRLGEWLTLAFLILSVLVIYFYLYLSGRVFINRVDSIIWYVAIIPVLMMCKRCLFPGLTANIIVTLALLIGFQAWHYSDLKWLQTPNNNADNIKKIYSEFSNDEEHLYIATLYGVTGHPFYDTFDVPEFGVGKNTCFIAGWDSYAPIQTDKLKRFGVRNPFTDAVNNDEVYWVDENINFTLTYIHKHYDKNVRAELVKQIEQSRIYRLVSP